MPRNVESQENKQPSQRNPLRTVSGNKINTRLPIKIGLSKSTIWRHKQKQILFEKQAAEKLELEKAVMENDEYWSDLAIEEIEKWPRVGEAAKAIILEKGRFQGYSRPVIQLAGG